MTDENTPAPKSANPAPSGEKTVAEHDVEHGAQGTFAKALVAMASHEMSEARGDNRRTAEMLEALARTLGATIAITAVGKQPVIAGLLNKILPRVHTAADEAAAALAEWERHQ